MSREMFCPTCLGKLRERSGALFCENGHAWPVQNGIPCLVPALSADALATAGTFATKWELAVEAVREERVRVANDWFFQRFRCSFEGRLGLRWCLAMRRSILDAGCGLGNLTTLLAELAPQAEVWGVDLTRSVHHVKRLPNLHLLQADLRCLPLGGQFDFIVSDGVLHHTDNTREAFLAVAARLAPGGDFLSYIYRKKAPIREFADDLLREKISAMAPEQALEVCEALTDLGQQLREARVVIHLERALPLLGIEAGDHDLQRLIYWHFLKCFWDDGGNRTASVVENFDWYHPRLAWRHTLDEVEGWIEEAGLERVHVDVSESGFSVHARRAGRCR